MSSFDLYKIALKNRFKVSTSENFKNALNKITTKEKKLIVIFGSLYLSGYVLSIN